MGPTVVEEVVVVEAAAAVLTRAMVSLLVRVIASRAMEATTRALTAAPALTTREDIAAMVSPRQEDTALRPLTRGAAAAAVVVIIIPVSPIALEATTAATSLPT